MSHESSTRYDSILARVRAVLGYTFHHRALLSLFIVILIDYSIRLRIYNPLIHMHTYLNLQTSPNAPSAGAVDSTVAHANLGKGFAKRADVSRFFYNIAVSPYLTINDYKPWQLHLVIL